MSDEPTTDGVQSDESSEDDAVLLAELRALASASDPVPAEAIAAARSAIAWRTIDAELAELTADMSVEGDRGGVRGAIAPALLTFEAAGLTVEIEVMEDGHARRLLGQLVPPEPGEIEVRHGGGRSGVVADRMGRFAASGVEAGPVSIRCRLGTTVVETDWFLA